MKHTVPISTTGVGWRTWTSAPAWRTLGLLMLCSAYIQGGLDKAFDFPAAIAEMRHFGLAPAAPMALLTIVGELLAPLLIVSGMWRWAGALYLGGFTVMASLLANPYWRMSGTERFMNENAFFEHLGLAGAFLLVAWLDLRKE
ncbi:DoxX family protein [Rugamonas sp.]|uniref:DoxX family protein n=1 Tax=Rugamonas sp. TaxID=1926287 RepID=UPI0025FD1C80|nr:DoxX family protein [Rugamonas sp.]